MSQAATTAPAPKAAPAAESLSGIEQSGAPLPVILVTGLSGAGHSTALRALEDLGYEAVDNLPLALLNAPASFDRPVALGIDSRTRGFSAAALLERIQRLKAEPGQSVSLVFLTCSDEVLQRRFTETRRRHPLALDRPIADGIRQERLLLEDLADAADLVIDSTDLAIGDLKRLMQGHFALDRRPGSGHRRDVLFLSLRPAAGSRSGLRRALPRQSALPRRSCARSPAAMRRSAPISRPIPPFGPSSSDLTRSAPAAAAGL